MNEQKTLLEYYCMFRGWASGSYSEMMRDYSKLPLAEKDRFTTTMLRVGFDNLSRTSMGMLQEMLSLKIGA